MNNKKILLGLLFLFIVLFAGCGNKTDDKKQIPNKENIKTNNNTPKIEIIENKDAYKVKVKQKNNNMQNDKYYFNYGIKSEYDPNAQPSNKDASVRVKPRTAIDANLHIRSPYEKVKISMLVKKLSKKFIVKCSACHNDYANGIIGPSLLNKTPKEILKNISDFKDGTKSNPLMTDLIKLTKESEIKELANEIYEFNKKIKEMRK